MSEEPVPILNEAASNVVENIAYQVAQHHGGVITVNHLAPYLPLSLGLIRLCLDNMVDGHTVTTGEQDGFPIYEFTRSEEAPAENEKENERNCLSCTTHSRTGDHYLCRECQEALEKELNRVAESTGWPAKAVYEHEILYLAARRQGPHNAAELAGYSRYTLKRMQKKLKAMGLERYLTQDLDKTVATITYRFPEISYPKKAYQRNMDIIRRYPASIAEDMELKIIRIILSFTGMLLAVFALAFLRIPLPVLIIGFVVIAPVIAIRIWRHKDKPPEE